jgi:hypothetical protein
MLHELNAWEMHTKFSGNVGGKRPLEKSGYRWHYPSAEFKQLGSGMELQGSVKV